MTWSQIICKSGWPSWSNAMSKITNITNININYTMTSLNKHKAITKDSLVTHTQSVHRMFMVECWAGGFVPLRVDMPRFLIEPMYPLFPLRLPIVSALSNCPQRLWTLSRGGLLLESHQRRRWWPPSCTAQPVVGCNGYKIIITVFFISTILLSFV